MYLISRLSDLVILVRYVWGFDVPWEACEKSGNASLAPFASPKKKDKTLF